MTTAYSNAPKPRTNEEEHARRVAIVKQASGNLIRHREAAQTLKVSVRQVRRLVRVYRAEGEAGLCSRRGGRPALNRLSPKFVGRVLGLVRKHYSDFKPTLAQEKLLERHKIRISRETLRKRMAEAGLWQPHAQRRRPIQQLREPRAQYGELIQIDGSDHPWFEDRAPRCTALVYIDDATSKLQLVRFVQQESAFSYMNATKLYLKRYGRPLAFYSDRHTVFRPSRKNSQGERGITQFSRALSTLDISIICAYSPAAKGRVERVHGTLQDRLVKEMRLERISSVKQANAWIDGYVEKHNLRFARVPREPLDAHRPLEQAHDLDEIFTRQKQAIVSKQLQLQYEGVTYLIEPTRKNEFLRRKHVEVVQYPDERPVSLRYQGRELVYRTLRKRRLHLDQGKVISSKELNAALDSKRLSLSRTASPRRDRRRSKRGSAHCMRAPTRRR